MVLKDSRVPRNHLYHRKQ